MRRARRGTRGGRAGVAAAPEGRHRADRRAAHARATRRRVVARRRSASSTTTRSRRSTRSSPVRAAERPRPTPGNGALVTRDWNHGRLRSPVHDARHAAREARPDPARRAEEDPRRRDPRAERRQHAELALHARRRPGGQGADRADLPDVPRHALGRRSTRIASKLPTPTPTIPRARRCCACSVPRSTSPTTSRSTRCSSSASCSSTRPADRSSRRRGRRCSRREPKASARRSPRVVNMFKGDDIAEDPRRAEGRRLADLVDRVTSATRPASGASPPAGRCTKSASATSGENRSGFEVPKPLWP